MVGVAIAKLLPSNWLELPLAEDVADQFQLADSLKLSLEVRVSKDALLLREKDEDAVVLGATVVSHWIIVLQNTVAWFVNCNTESTATRPVLPVLRLQW